MTARQVRKEAFWSFFRGLMGSLWFGIGNWATFCIGRTREWIFWFMLGVGVTVSLASVLTLFLARYRLENGIYDQEPAE